jgi:hypothetical protein
VRSGFFSAQAGNQGNSSDGLPLHFVSGSNASIFVRKALHIRLRDRNMRSRLQARREGYALFDEDDACAGI